MLPYKNVVHRNGCLYRQPTLIIIVVRSYLTFVVRSLLKIIVRSHLTTIVRSQLTFVVRSYLTIVVRSHLTIIVRSYKCWKIAQLDWLMQGWSCVSYLCPISAVQKIKKLSESPATAHTVAKVCVINCKGSSIYYNVKMAEKVPNLRMGWKFIQKW